MIIMWAEARDVKLRAVATIAGKLYGMSAVDFDAVLRFW